MQPEGNSFSITESGRVHVKVAVKFCQHPAGLMYDAVGDHAIDHQCISAHYVAYRQTPPVKLIVCSIALRACLFAELAHTVPHKASAHRDLGDGSTIHSMLQKAVKGQLVPGVRVFKSQPSRKSTSLERPGTVSSKDSSTPSKSLTLQVASGCDVEMLAITQPASS